MFINTHDLCASLSCIFVDSVNIINSLTGFPVKSTPPHVPHHGLWDNEILDPDVHNTPIHPFSISDLLWFSFRISQELDSADIVTEIFNTPSVSKAL